MFLSLVELRCQQMLEKKQQRRCYKRLPLTKIDVVLIFHRKLIGGNYLFKAVWVSQYGNQLLHFCFCSGRKKLLLSCSDPSWPPVLGRRLSSHTLRLPRRLSAVQTLPRSRFKAIQTPVPAQKKPDVKSWRANRGFGLGAPPQSTAACREGLAYLRSS